MICMIYVDDCLFFAKEMPPINEMIEDLQKDLVLEPEEDMCLKWMNAMLRKPQQLAS